MDWTRLCAAVIPCRNEETAIGPLVEAVRRRIPAAFVVDDGSHDQTAVRAEAAGAVVLRNPVSRGKGAALTSGWTRARQLGFSWALSLDGDGQHSPRDIDHFLECAERTGAALVVGNRMHEVSAMPRVRSWVNRLMSRQISKLAGQSLPDSQCGFRLMNLECWAPLPIRAEHFEIESEVLFEFVIAGMNVQFVPIQVIYKQEQSKIHPWHDTLRWLRWRGYARRKRESLISGAQVACYHEPRKSSPSPQPSPPGEGDHGGRVL